MLRSLRVCSVVLCTLMATMGLRVSGLFAQAPGNWRLEGDSADYHWSDDGKYLWFTVEDGAVEDGAGEDGAGERQFRIVNLNAGHIGDLFDSGRLADALTKQLGSKVTHLRGLSVDEIDAGGSEFVFQFKGDAWRCTSDYQLSRVEDPHSFGSWLTDDVRSRTGGEECYVEFINDLDVPFACTWRSFEGGAVEYDMVRPGDSFRQHTYVGHVWSLRGAGNEELVRVKAQRDQAVRISHELVEEYEERFGRRDRRPGRRISPATRNAFIRDGNIWLGTAEGDQDVAPRQLTTDGGDKIRYRRLIESPDGRFLAAIRVAIAEEREIPLVETKPRDRLQPILRMIRYRKPGDEIDRPEVVLFDVQKAERVAVSGVEMPNPWSIDRLAWLENPLRLLYVYNQRGHQRLQVLSEDPEAGTRRVLIGEQSDTFIDYAHKTYMRTLKGGREILWASERSGFNHLYRFDAASGQLINAATSGKWVLRSVERVDEDRELIWFYASGVIEGQDPYYKHLCRVGFDGSGFIVLTEGDGDHRCEFSPDDRWIIDRYSRVDMPPIAVLRSAKDGAELCQLSESSVDQWRARGWTLPERFVATGRDGQTEIYGVIIKPPGFADGGSFPIVEKIYAGPHSSHVPKQFGRLRQEHQFSEQGFVVVLIDGMGTSNRGKAFHDVCWKNLADAGFPDRKLWIRAAAKKYPQMDLQRVGIFGGSAGGQNAMRALIDHHDFYHVAVADCGCHDNRMDKIWWNEAWMGWPVDQSYEDSSNMVHAGRVEGELMLIVGGRDSNVDPQSTLQVVEALVRAGKDFELVYLPSAGHGAAETAFGRRKRMKFLVEHLQPSQPTAESVDD